MSQRVNSVVDMENSKAFMRAIANPARPLVFVKFGHDQCAPCRQVSPFFAELAEKNPSVTFINVDVKSEGGRVIANAYKVEAGFPILMFFWNRQLIYSDSGNTQFMDGRLQSMIDQMGVA